MSKNVGTLFVNWFFSLIFVVSVNWKQISELQPTRMTLTGKLYNIKINENVFFNFYIIAFSTEFCVKSLVEHDVPK